ncbi:MAG TPA: hypothetical protein PK620_13770, partial [Denitromonas sp.]|uniref:hypothetical protein n=1 Tax=Denitromonas sp. TaxID=2734609 RepID=UPI002BFF25CC|nr:hypothetical protein [Denitromonas sp.]
MTEMNLANSRSLTFDALWRQSKFLSLKLRYLVVAAALTWSALTASGPAQAADEHTIVGTWQGTYTCGNVEGGLTLKLEEGSNGLLEGEFHFEITRPRPAQGTYRVRGRYQPGSRSFTAVPAEWIDRPSGYRAVGMSGAILESGLIISGDLRGCGGVSRFEARRSGARTTTAGTIAVASDTLTAPTGGPFEGHWRGVMQCTHPQIARRRLPDMQLDLDILQDENAVVAVTRLQAPSPYGLKRQIWQGSIEGDVASLGPGVTQLEGSRYYTAKSARLEAAGDGRLSVYLEGITVNGKNCDPLIVSRSGAPQVPSVSHAGDIAGIWSGYTSYHVSRIRDLERIDSLRALAQGDAGQLRMEIADDGGKLYGIYSTANPVGRPPAEQDRFSATIRPLLVLEDGRVAFAKVRATQIEGVFAPERGGAMNATLMFLVVVSLEDDGQLLVEQLGSGKRAFAYRLHRSSEAEAGALALGEAPPVPLPSTLGGTFANAPSLDAQCRAVVQWAEPVTSSHDLGRMMVSKGQEAQLPLFEDSAFEPVFGKPYALTTAEERGILNQMVRRICPGRVGMNTIVASALEYGFGQERNFEKIVGKLFDRQESTSWLETAMAEIGTLPIDTLSYGRLSAIEDEAESRGKDIPPESRAALHAALA